MNGCILAAETATPLKNVPAVNDVFMGIDPSLVRTGVAVVTTGHLRTGTLAPPDKLRGPHRLEWFYERFDDLLQAIQPRIVGVEGYAFGARAQHHALGELGGVLRLCLVRRRQPFVVVPPTVLKKFACGKGNVEKSVVAKELYKRFDIDLPNNDEVDAAGLAVLTLAAHAPGTRIAATHKDALKKIERFY